MRVPVRIPKLTLPRGLAARAVLFVTLLMTVTATLSAVIVLLGAHREGVRQQAQITQDLTRYLAGRAGEVMSRGRSEVLSRMIEGASRQDNVRSLSIRDTEGQVLAQDGDRDASLVEALALRVLATGAPVSSRGRGGVIGVGAPIRQEGRLIGVALRTWDRDAYRFDVVPALAPFLLILACLVLAAVYLTAHTVRRAVAPLNVLAQFASRLGERGQAAPLDVRTGDEFETLAKALNHMTKRLEASMRQIQEIAFVDPSTRLPNQERLQREINFFILQGASDGKDATAAVAVFELLRLTRLMQTLDPEASRDLLRTVAERFTGAVRTVDRFVRLNGASERAAMAARLGGVEFGVFVPGVASLADAARFAQHLNAALNQPFEWRGHKLTLGACCGLALAPRDGRDADAVIRHARMALHAAHTAPARMKVFTSSLDRETVARLTLEREMRGALDRNEFRAYFQPKINLATGRIEACEALARWVRPDRTIISPGRFIPVAEESGLIGPLSDAIMREACWKAAAWARAGYPTKVAVNVSALQFRHDNFADNVLRVLQHSSLTPEHLELEITETVAMQDPDRALRLIKPLRDAGVRLAIDDFGCGHSSLAALSKLPFDVIKVDQQFVRAMERGDARAATIIELIFALARTLDMEVVAEGVERREDMEFMAARGCHWIQGFLYGAAVSAPEFSELLRRQAMEEAADAA